MKGNTVHDSPLQQSCDVHLQESPRQQDSTVAAVSTPREVTCSLFRPPAPPFVLLRAHAKLQMLAALDNRGPLHCRTSLCKVFPMCLFHLAM